MYDEYFGEIVPTRRGFLGSIIGTIVSTQLPFTALAAKKDRFDNRLYSRLERLLYLKEKDFLKFKSIIHTLEGGHIWTPGMKAWNDNVFGNQDLNVNQTITAYSSSLIDDEGYLIMSGVKFYSTVPLFNGDTLKLTFTIPSFEIIEKAIHQPNFDHNGMIITPQTKALKFYI